MKKVQKYVVISFLCKKSNMNPFTAECQYVVFQQLKLDVVRPQLALDLVVGVYSSLLSFQVAVVILISKQYRIKSYV